MTEAEKIAYAKSFIDKLANGINPLDDSPIPEDDIVSRSPFPMLFLRVYPASKGDRSGKQKGNEGEKGRETSVFDFS